MLLRSFVTQRLFEASSPIRSPRRPTSAGRDNIVGRDGALDALDDWLQAAAVGTEALTICGDRGMGRTTLWAYAVARARGLGFRVLTMRAVEDEREVPGLALEDLFDADMGEAISPDSATPGFDHGRQVLTALRRLGADAVLVAVDDLQWLDPLSANALRFALHRLGDRRVSVLATVPTGYSGCSAPLGLLYARAIDLPPLPLEALRKALGRAVSPVSRPELAQAHELSGGNPGRALTLIRSWRGELRDQQGPDRFGPASLSAEAREMLQTLAVAGPSPAGVIAAACGVADFPAAVREAGAAGLIEVGEDLSMRVRDPVGARVVAAAMNPVDLCSVHARLAEIVTDPVSRARHAALATLAPSDQLAGELERVAHHSAEAAAPAVAAELLAHAVRLTPRTDEDAAARRAAAEIVQRAAAGETARAMELADRLLARLSAGPRRAQVLALRVILDTAESRAFLHQALADAGADEGLRASILDLLGWLSGFYQGRVTEGLTESAEALALATRIGDRDVAVLAGATLALTSSLAGRPREDLFGEVLEQAATARLSPLGRWPRVFRARHLLWSGHLGQARRIFLRMQRDATVRGSEFQRPYRLADLAMVELAAGDLVAARQRAGDGIEAARDAGNEQAVVWLAHPLGVAAALQGDADTAIWAADLLAAWAVVNEEPPRQAMADDVLGNLAATSGDWHTALRHFDSVVRQLDAMGYRHPGAVPAISRAIEAASMAGDADSARAYTDQLADQAASVEAPLVDAFLRSAHGQLALLTDDDGIDDLTAATSQLDDLGYAFEAARVRLPLARAQLRTGQRAQARLTAKAAGRTFAEAGAVGWVAAADVVLARAGAAPTQGGELTGTEQEVARMVAAGRMNREIADLLFVSTSTVEAHLTRIYRKLGLRSRTELATWLQKLG
jgi:DNA-binding NarL/FixJ family response regulator